MIAAYAFLTAFAVQILTVSVLNPARLILYVRGWARNFGSERFVQMYQGIDYERWVERFSKWFRAANIVVALLGVLLLSWLLTVVRQPGWRDEVSTLTAAYFLLQMAPLMLFALYAIVKFKLLDRMPQDAKRKAILQRRGLFDFVSPFVVVVAVLSYFLFVVYSIYLDLYVYLNTSLSKYCYNAIIAVTLAYAVNAFIIYTVLYGKNNPLVRHESRVLAIGITVRSGVYSCIAVAWFISITGTLGPEPELQAWRPFVLSAFLVTVALLGRTAVTLPPRKPEAGRLDTSPAP